MSNHERSAPILSVHIEKTAGTSLEAWWMELFGPEKILIYNAYIDRLLLGTSFAGKRTNPFINSVREKLGGTPLYSMIQKALAHSLKAREEDYLQPEALNKVPNIEVIHGHFSANRFDAIFPNAQSTVVFREPLQRMISHYEHWQRAEGRMTHRIRVPYNKRLSFQQFALLPELKNYQTQALGGKKIDDFWVVGTTEKLGNFMQKVIESGNFSHSVPNKSSTHFNKSPRKLSGDQLGLTFSFVKEFERQHEQDYQLFELASKDIR